MRKPGIIASGYNVPAAGGLVRTSLASLSTAAGYGNSSATTSSFATTSGGLLVVGLAAAIAGGITFAPTISNSGTALTWTPRVLISLNTTGWTDGLAVWTAPVATGASITVAFFHGGLSMDNYSGAVVGYTGQNVTTPVAGIVTNNAMVLDGAATLTLTAAPLAADETLGFLMRSPNSGTPSSTPGAGFTELYDLNNSTTDVLEVQARSGSTSTSVPWADVSSGTTDMFRVMGAAMNVKAA